MIGFDVFINGKKACRAAIGRTGVLTTHVVWAGPRKRERARRRPSETWVSTSGLVTDESTSESGGSHVDWFHAKLTAGDEVRIKVVDVADSDAPRGSRPPLSKLPHGAAPSLMNLQPTKPRRPKPRRKPKTNGQKES